MNLEELKNEKDLLESKISSLCQEFSKKTNLKVKSIYSNRLLGCYKDPGCYIINVDVEL